MKKELRDFLLGRSISELDAYPESHPHLYRVTDEEWEALLSAGPDGVLVGYGDVRYVATNRHPFESKTGLCGSCEYRRLWESGERVSAPRAECKWPDTSKYACYCWKLRKDLEPEKTT